MGIGIGTAVTIGMGVLGAGSAYASYNAQQKAAKHQKHLAERAAAQALERERLEAELRREQIEYEANLAAERAQWETGVSLEKAEYTKERIAEETALVRAAQIVGYAASGVNIQEGSPLQVMKRASKDSQTEQMAVTRGHELFAETRSREAEEVKLGGEKTYEWFRQRLNMETQYEVQSRMGEAREYRQQGKQLGYGSYFGIASSALSGASSGYNLMKKYDESK